MGRWRPPQEASSPYITAEGYKTLQRELKDTWRHRAEVVKALSAAAAEGDRSENAEYIYRKKELAGIDRRIRYLQKRLPQLNVVERSPAGERVFFGAWVTLEREDGRIEKYRIVGADELDAASGYISVDSPLAQALLKKTVGDAVELALETGAETLVIAAVEYPGESGVTCPG